jgi:hypothetical protein
MEKASKSPNFDIGIIKQLGNPIINGLFGPLSMDTVAQTISEPSGAEV